MVGVQVKSQYCQLVATGHNEAVVAKPVKSAYKQFQLFFLIVLQSYCTLILLLLIPIAQPEVNAAGIVGVPVKSQYLPEVATVHSNGVLVKLI
jgi:hypothetical protein